MSSAPSLSSGGAPPGYPPVSTLSSSSSSSSPVGDLADFHARMLGLSAEYQALGHLFVASRGLDFRSYLASYCPHLYSDFLADFASGSSRFLAALSSSASLPLPSSSVPSSVSKLSLPSQPPVAPVPVSSSLAPSAPPFRFLAPLLTPLSSSAPSALPPVFWPPPVSSSPSLSLPDWCAVPGGSSVAPGLAAVPVSLPVPPPASVPSLFHPFAADLAPSVPVPAAPLSSAFPSAPSAPDVVPGPSFSSSTPPPFLVAASSSFVAPDELPEDAAPDTLPRDADSAVPEAFPESVRSEFRRMLSFLVDLFPQASGTLSAPPPPPPPHAVFEDFFGSSVPSSSIFLSWFERVRMSLSDADARLDAFLSSGRSDFSFLPPRNSSYAVKGDFASGQAVPMNPSLLSLFEKQLKPSYLVGLSVWEAAALESSLRSQAEALSHSMWVLSGLLGFVRLQNFAPADSKLFNTLVTSLLKSLAHQASLCASHTAFLVLKRRQFYLSHLSAYFSDVNKRSMLAALAVCSDFVCGG